MTKPYYKPADAPRLGDRIFAALCEHPYGLTTGELIAAVYPDPDREPEYAWRCLHVEIWRMRQRLAVECQWLTIGRASPGRYAIYLRRPREVAYGALQQLVRGRERPVEKTLR